MTLATNGGAALTPLTLASRTDGNTTLTRPSLTVAAGETVQLTITSSGLLDTDTYDFTVMGTKKTTPSTLESMTALTGIKNSAGNSLSIPASGWTPATTGGSATYSGKTVYWTNEQLNGPAASSRTFTISVPAGTTPDVYSLTARVPGNYGSGSAFGTSQEIFLNVVPEPGTLVLLLGGTLVGLVCWRGRKRLAAK
jgi:hypothetical protein